MWGGVVCPMAHISGHDRSQMLLLPEAVDDYVSPDHPVRFIEAFVDGLDLEAAGFARVAPKLTGRPGYAPADLLKLYIYGYLNRIRSSRRLEAEAGRNLEGSGCFATSSPTSRPLLTSAATIATPSGRSSAHSCCCAANSTCSGAS